MKLVIVESPAKCKKIASFLGPGFKVLATMGHIRTLEQDLSAIGLDNDFNLRFTFMKEKAATMNAIKEAAKRASLRS
jgi:DNA topoisomerase-1